MGASRRKHSREFKLEAIKQVTEKGRSVAEVADGLGINRNQLHRWKAEFEAEGQAAFPGNGNLSPADDELRRLRRELAIAQQERDILKKAVAFFAKAKS